LLKQLGRLSYARSKRAKTVLRLAFGLAVGHEVVPRNPIDRVATLHKPKRTPTALTAAEVNAIRAVIKAWEHTRGTSGPNCYRARSRLGIRPCVRRGSPCIDRAAGSPGPATDDQGRPLRRRANRPGAVRTRLPQFSALRRRRNELEYPERLGDDATTDEASEAVGNAQAIITAAEGLLDQLGLF